VYEPYRRFALNEENAGKTTGNFLRQIGPMIIRHHLTCSSPKPGAQRVRET
jgi:hypothetical protein